KAGIPFRFCQWQQQACVKKTHPYSSKSICYAAFKSQIGNGADWRHREHGARPAQIFDLKRTSRFFSGEAD
ncbi:MAG: hypothetical protein WBQ06_17295, partial [Acidobacteriaceae bacterium]